MGPTATAYATTTTPAGVQHNDLAKWLQTATEIRMADLYTITLKNPLGSGVNLVPDPSGTLLTWNTVNALPGLPFSPTGGALGGGCWTYAGTGAPSGFYFPVSQVITVTPGATYTLSGHIDARNSTAGALWAVYRPDIQVPYGSVSQAAGVSGRVSASFTVPAGVTQVVVICDTDNVTVNAGQSLVFSNPQLELGATATPYANASKLRYTTWDSNLTVLGNTFLTGPPHFQRSHIEEKIGLDVANLDLEVTASATDLVNGVPILQLLASGVFDGAMLQIDRLFMDASGMQIGTVVRFSGIIGEAEEIGRSSAKLTVNALVQLLSMQLPRTLLQPGCTHTLFDAECALVKSNFARSSAAAGGCTPNKVNTTLTDPDGYYDNGQIVFTSGVNSGLVKAVRLYSGRVIYFNSPLPFAPNAGDTFTVYPGCDKTQSTCQNKFNNLQNFGGYPYVPAPEAAL
jgi:uncharacterized phage protein (TIGR02218 family)